METSELASKKMLKEKGHTCRASLRSRWWRASGHLNSLLQMGDSHSMLTCRPSLVRVLLGLVAMGLAVEERTGVMAAVGEPLRECWRCDGVANCLVRLKRR